jgi:hypothetical protein
MAPQGPAKLLALAANHRAAPVARAYTKCKFHNGRNHDHALGLFQEIAGNVVWHIEHFLHDNATPLEAFLLIVQFLCVYCSRHKSETRCGN